MPDPATDPVPAPTQPDDAARAASAQYLMALRGKFPGISEIYQRMREEELAAEYAYEHELLSRRRNDLAPDGASPHMHD